MSITLAAHRRGFTMPMHSDWLGPVLSVLATNLDGVLPATGGAMEDMEWPDIDEIEDVLINGDGSKQITDFLETPTPTLDNFYRPTPPLFRKEKHLYHFFIDG